MQCSSIFCKPSHTKHLAQMSISTKCPKRKFQGKNPSGEHEKGNRVPSFFFPARIVEYSFEQEALAREGKKPFSIPLDLIKGRENNRGSPDLYPSLVHLILSTTTKGLPLGGRCTSLV